MYTMHRDPTMDTAAFHESRDCSGCKHLFSLLGASTCTKHKWKKQAKMYRCEMWEFEMRNEPIWRSPNESR